MKKSVQQSDWLQSRDFTDFVLRGVRTSLESTHNLLPTLLEPKQQVNMGSTKSKKNNKHTTGFKLEIVLPLIKIHVDP